jgi:hypothetical protein
MPCFQPDNACAARIRVLALSGPGSAEARRAGPRPTRPALGLSTPVASGSEIAFVTGDSVAVLVRMVAADMDAAAYDDVSTYLGRQMKKQPGFMMHVAFPGPGGFVIEELWESQDQFERWMDGNVRPNVPGIQQQVIELHAVVVRP